jgi:hypothetical protein
MFTLASAFQVTTQNVSAAPSLLDQCVSSINESGFTKEFILSETGFSDETALLSAVSSGAWTIQISTGPSWNPTLRSNASDIYCGDSGDNTVDMLDSHPTGTHDFFFAGAGNDVVNYMWDSRYWGGSGNDTIHNNRERSIFYGGSGTNTCSNRESSGAIAICDNSGGPALSQAALSLVDTTLTLGSTLSLSTAGGSGSGLVSYVVSSAGSAGCSLSGAVLSVTSSGTCTVTASKAADATYAAASSGAVTITVTAATTTTTSTTTTVAPVVVIEIQAPVTTVAQGQASLATIAPTTTVAARRAQSTTSTTEVGLSTSAVVTTTTLGSTTTTITPPKVAAVAAGETAVQVDGVETKSQVSRENNQLVVSAGALKATIGGLNKNGTAMSLDEDGNVRLRSGDVVRIKLAGFKPGNTVEAWLFSTPVLLGSSVVSADGSVTGNFTIPKNTPEGSHRIVIVAKSTNGKPTTFTVGVAVGEIATTSTLTRVLIAIPIALAIGIGFLIPNQLRRRRKVIAQ